MSRYEVAEFEKKLREFENPEFEEDEDVRQTEEFKNFREEIKQLQPMRHALIKQYFMKFRYQKKKREDILASAEEAEAYTQDVLGDEYVHFKDAIPEIKQFLEELETKQKPTLEEKKDEKEGIVEEIHDPAKFDPFNPKKKAAKKSS